jgi:tetratricopeptide (TPR) repeat protein
LIAELADLGWTYGILGDAVRGLELAARAVDLSEQFPMMRPWAAAALARLRLMQGDVAGASAALANGYRDFNPEGFFGATMMIGLAEAHTSLDAGQPERALERIQQLLGALQTLNGRGMRSEALYLKGRALLMQGQHAEARAALAEARTEAEQLGSRRTLWPILLAQAEAEEAQGNLAEAAALRRQAGDVVQQFAQGLSDPDLRQSFLNLPNIRAVVEYSD